MPPVLAAARCSQFLDYQGNAYPGFINLSCNYSGLDQSGLITWEGTAEIAWVPGNPTNIDNRKNKVTWCFGRVVDLRVANDSGNFERPKCIPKMYIYKAMYNPHTEKLRLELRDILGLLRDRSIDDFRNDFDEPNDIVEDPAKVDEPIACGTPDDGTLDETEQAKQEEKKNKYWWEQWQKEGTEQNNVIIHEIMSRLGITIQGSVSGTIRLPYTLSGSLISACGDLAFKSLTPSYIWSNYLGVAVISQIDIKPPRNKFYVSGFGDIDYSPVENGLNPISELIVIGQLKELDENTPQEETDENGNPEHCEVITETGPETVIDPGGNATAIIDLSVTTICEVVTQYKKVITTSKKERYGLLFPDSLVPDSNPSQWIDLSYKKIEEQFYDACTGALIKKIITEWNPWGKVFGEFYSKHLDFVIDPDEFGLLNSDFSTTLISPYADYASSDPTLIKDRTETANYYYKKQKLYKIETIVEEPMSKVLTDYHDALPANNVFGGDILNPYKITASSLEQWYEWGNGHQTHLLIERDCLNRQNSAAVAKREEYLSQSLADLGADIPAFEQEVYTRFYTRSATDIDNIEPGIRFNTVVLPDSLITPSERLALIEKRTVTESSREGLANPPATEYLPRGKANEVNKNATEKWITKPIVFRRKWLDAKCSDWLPSQEIVELGEIVTREIIDVLGGVIYYLRQGQSYVHELFLPFTQDWISGNFKPTFRVDVKECEDAYCHLAHGITMEFSQKENSLLLELLWLGETSISTPISSTQSIAHYTISSLPPTLQGTLYLEGVAVTSGQQITPAQLPNLTFTPAVTFTGSTFSYSASDGVATSSSGLTVTLAPASGGYNPVIPDTEPLVSTITVATGTNTQVILPPDVESNGITPTVTVDDEFTYTYEMKNILRRLKSDTNKRLTLELGDRTTIYQ
jgi:hypothetical protein